MIEEIFAGLGPRYAEAREMQRNILIKIARELGTISSTKLGRLTMLELPTGIGKSAIAISLAELIGSPFTVINTATISLQNQYDADFPRVCKLVGRDNFECTLRYKTTAANAPCVADSSISCNSDFYAQEEEYRRSAVVVTNYALYMSELLKGKRWHERRPHLLVCDEGHRLLDFLTQAETITVDRRLCEKLNLKVPASNEIEPMQTWAKLNVDKVRKRAFGLTLSGSKWAKAWLSLMYQLQGLATSPAGLIVTRADDLFEATPLWPRKSAESLLQSANHVLVMSATLWGGDFFAELLGYKDDYKYISAPSPFDKWRWPVYYRPVASMNKDSSIKDWERMGLACHEYIHSRSGDKGIIHVASVSQVDRLARTILRCQDCRSRLVLLRRGGKRVETLDRFRASKAGWIIHPSIGEGESFDDEQCRIQLIAKIRYPDLADPLVNLRANDGGMGQKFYFNSTAAYTSQTIGRGMRSADDYCETYILDGSFANLYDRNKKAFPQWFHDQLR